MPMQAFNLLIIITYFLPPSPACIIIIDNLFSSNYFLNSHAPSCFVDDLQNRMRDLQASNADMAAKLERSERTISELMNENNALRTADKNKWQELKQENELLREQVLLI